MGKNLGSLPMVNIENVKGETIMQVIEENTKTVRRRLPGRPKKGIKRSEILMIRLTPTERLLIEDKSKKAGMKPSEWLRNSAKGISIIPRFSNEETGWFRMLSGLANNLNQLTHLAHVHGLISLSSKCRTMVTQIEQLLFKISNHDR